MVHEVNIEQFDALSDYLVQKQWLRPGEPAAFEVLPGGVSSRTVRVARSKGPSWVLKQSLPKLRVQMDWYSDPMRIHREALGLRWLAQLAPAGHVPEFVFEDFEQHILAMSAVGLPHENWKAMLLDGRIEDDHIRQFGTLLGAVHARGWARRDELEPLFRDRSFFESLRVEPYYECSAALVPAAQKFLDRLIRLTRERLYTLVHGDYSPKNILIWNGQLILLDHEVIHFGDPAFDVGFALTHLLSKAHHLADRRADFANASQYFWNCYYDALPSMPWMNDLEEMTVYHTLGCLLARTSGRSPLEYLSVPERERQRSAVLQLMKRCPATVGELVSHFLGAL